MYFRGLRLVSHGLSLSLSLSLVCLLAGVCGVWDKTLGPKTYACGALQVGPPSKFVDC